jgi:hypothetical protein
MHRAGLDAMLGGCGSPVGCSVHVSGSVVKPIIHCIPGFGQSTSCALQQSGDKTYAPLALQRTALQADPTGILRHAMLPCRLP